MSTTEQPVPAIGSAEWARALPPSVNTCGDFEFKRTHVWTDDHGVTQALISFGAVDLTFHSPESLRAAIGRLAALAGEMDAEITRQQPTEVAPAPGPQCTGRPDCLCGHGYHNNPLTGTARACSRCGATTTPLDDFGQCWNDRECVKRANARDAEASQAGTR